MSVVTLLQFNIGHCLAAFGAMASRCNLLSVKLAIWVRFSGGF